MGMTECQSTTSVTYHGDNELPLLCTFGAKFKGRHHPFEVMEYCGRAKLELRGPEQYTTSSTENEIQLRQTGTGGVIQDIFFFPGLLYIIGGYWDRK